jgi:hypothetical protein
MAGVASDVDEHEERTAEEPFPASAVEVQVDTEEDEGQPAGRPSQA